ncbi:regulatory LuxR family protein [Knoellia remsis]|uniref:Regulatory LuxR family protein n=1 Tax=Knoellia remsis TaxID=407159 RepID=A0A2T0UCL8_9MICO|nr:LuxR C-terminal-related transcriptional regulator [Knoellia remsis]PRY55680.1 regulatory LuxR family protein [Knoellia remsis]
MDDVRSRSLTQRTQDIERRQCVLDALVPLQVARSRCAERLATKGDVEGVDVVATGGEISDAVMARSRAWRHLRSIQMDGGVERVQRSMPNNRSCLSDGLDMVSIWDEGGLEPAARRLISGEDDGSYRFSIGHLEMKIIDKRQVMLQGPTLDGAASVMVVRRPEVLAAAVRYWRAVVALSHAAADDETAPVVASRRQQRIVSLLAQDLCDDAIADCLGVSVRTVRSDIATLMRALGVRSRFAAGVKCQALMDD